MNEITFHLTSWKVNKLVVKSLEKDIQGNLFIADTCKSRIWMNFYTFQDPEIKFSNTLLTVLIF